jgi:hypothetical protein
LNLTIKELDLLALALNALVVSQKDVLAAAAELLPLREKLNTEAKRLKEEQDGPKP